MHNARTMGSVEPVGDLGADLRDLLERQRSTPQTVGERFSFQQFHH